MDLSYERSLRNGYKSQEVFPSQIASKRANQSFVDIVNYFQTSRQIHSLFRYRFVSGVVLCHLCFGYQSIMHA